jgi:hypothetical protein
LLHWCCCCPLPVTTATCHSQLHLPGVCMGAVCCGRAPGAITAPTHTPTALPSPPHAQHIPPPLHGACRCLRLSPASPLSSAAATRGLTRSRCDPACLPLPACLPAWPAQQFCVPLFWVAGTGHWVAGRLLVASARPPAEAHALPPLYCPAAGHRRWLCAQEPGCPPAGWRGQGK